MKRRLEGPCEMAASPGVSYQIRFEFCRKGCEDIIGMRETKVSPLLETGARERLIKTQQTAKKLS